MQNIINYYQSVIVQIATPYSTGTGFFIREFGLIITNEHVIRDNREVIIDGKGFGKQLATVLYTDVKYDVAFIEAPKGVDLPEISLEVSKDANPGEAVIAVGHPFGLKYTATQGIISNTAHQHGEINYWQHDAALNPGNSGGPLLNREGRVIGINTFIIQNGNNIGFSLPARYLKDCLTDYLNCGQRIASRCASCNNVVHEKTVEHDYCQICGSKVKLPSRADEYEPVGVSRTIEEMLEALEYDVRLSRRGPNNWEIQKGSARVNISYYEKTGLIVGDAFLCLLPSQNIQPIYEYLLRQNYELESLNFSVNGQDIILSLLIYDRYLNLDTGKKLFGNLFQMADHYDNILVEEFGAQWKTQELN